jgi:hypothetical protein
LPYVKPRDREFLNSGYQPDTAGELNYVLTVQCLTFLSYGGGPVTYEKLNAIVGALECAKQEFLRRMVAPYEDKKIAENGDVYPEATP